MKMEFSEVLSRKAEKADTVCRAWLPETEGQQKTVIEAMHYSIEAGGKRIRPVLISECFDLLCDDPETRQRLRSVVEAFMAAMEMIHTFSLCHDDLPCMDNDRYRRGELSTWAKFGEDMGTLTGDALVLYAFEAVTRALQQIDWSGCTAEVRLRETERVMYALHLLAEKSGVSGMLGGQVVDVEMTGKPLCADQLMFIYRLKTGALLEGSMMIGAVLAGASEDTVEKIREIALKIGVAFQIQDDILDETSTQEVLGKPIHSDAENEKTTYVSLYGLQEAATEVERLSMEAIQGIEKLPGNKDRSFLAELVRYLIHRKK